MLLRIIAALIVVLVLLIGLGWLGFRLPASGFPTPAAASAAPTQVPIPSGLPAPVERHVRALFGDTMPEVQTAVVTGTVSVTLNGLTMPAQFRFSYDARGEHYHEIQVTWFKLPVMFIHERFAGGRAQLDIPFFGLTENDSNTDRASLQGFYSEVLAFVPPIAFADPRVRWEPVDDTHARMVVPGVDEEEVFLLTFDAQTGLMTTLETLRYREAAPAAHERWSNHVVEYGMVDGLRVARLANTQWLDNPPWARWSIDHVALNVPVAERLARFGA